MDNGASSYRRYLDGDEDAFREIVSEYFDNLVFFIDRLVLIHPPQRILRWMPLPNW